jgi:dihydroxy-acid dehydratase
MPEAGYTPIPKKLARQGVKDMLRISDGRMSGTASGAVVLHVAPEAAVGGPLAVVREGDVIELDVDARRLHLCISPEELESRLAQWRRGNVGGKGRKRPKRGYRQLYHDHVTQANTGADFDFLQCSGAEE